MHWFSARFDHVDWVLLCAALLLSGAGLVTMNSFSGQDPFFIRQLIWLLLALVTYFGFALSDVRFLRRTRTIVGIYIAVVLMLGLLLIVGDVVLGARNRFDLGPFSFQPSDPAQIALILILAKYFSRRHVEIAHIRHIIVSGFYAFVLFALLFLQPDFGSAVAIFSIWLGMVLVSGISKKHLLLVVMVGAVTFGGLWMFAFADYQKERILTFLNPLSDIQGAGYNAYQSTIAVGSGQLWGKGIGYGTQSKLEFLPEYETDFIFAAFAEEWGFIGALIALTLFGIVIWRLLRTAARGASNFETLFCVGVAVMMFAHIVIHVGMNIGLLPVTGLTIPFMSYGGSHLITEFAALGIVTAMRRYERLVRPEAVAQEFYGM